MLKRAATTLFLLAAMLSAKAHAADASPAPSTDAPPTAPTTPTADAPPAATTNAPPPPATNPAPKTPAEPPPSFRIDFGGSLDNYGPNYDNPNFQHHRTGFEEMGFIEIGYRATTDLTVLAGYTASDPIQIFDQQVNVGAYYSVLPNLVLNTSIAYAPNRQIIAKWDLNLGADWQLFPWLALLGSVRHLDFPSDDNSGFPSGHDAVSIFSVGARFTISRRFNVMVQGGYAHHTGTFVDANGQETIPDTGYGLARLEYDALGPLWVTAFGSFGDDSRRPFNPQLIGTIGAVGAGARLQMNQMWTIRADYIHEAFEEEYIRDGVSTSVTVKF